MKDEESQSDDKPLIDTWLEHPVIWVSNGAMEHSEVLRKALNRHWIVTQWDGGGWVDLQDVTHCLQPRPVFRYYGRRCGEEVIEVYAWEPWVLFVSLAKETEDSHDPAARLERLTFTHDRALSLWFTGGADILRFFPQLRPAWHRENQTTESRQISHTPGPYSYRRGSDGCDDCWDILTPRDERPLVAVHFWDDEHGTAAARAEANARLFAAAPELLEALQVADAYLADNEATDFAATETRRSVLAAIAKAEGGRGRRWAQNRCTGSSTRIS